MPSLAPRRTSGARALLTAGAAVVVLGIAGCAGTDPEPTPTETLTPVVVTPSPTPTPEVPELQPEGTASENLDFFSLVVDTVWEGSEAVSGRAYVDALDEAGFDRGAMQVSEDETTLGAAVESLQFSVRWGDECLVGQVGPETGDPVTVVLPVIEGDRCLIGNTQPIDW
ncbi:hypothetical protein M4I32_01795 [Microbacterium sp. LRZ72]|uniref:DUF6993 domain-containing protein n=1 Tax=Microbacterium sp. LRZ72 TaxID=2942481 RepID=UPI0029A91DBE|nr:hypothetical protein [Microbacterium sp. LRZ72]MDX2375530.1 hypothetical protein [Microbacterium sp. LRZ72]